MIRDQEHHGDFGAVDSLPAVTVTEPADGVTVSGSSVLVAATASDDNGVTQVEFFVDGSSLGIDTTAPYSVTWDSTGVADGAHAVSATATDTIGQTGSDANNVIVANAPTTDVHLGALSGSSTPANKGRWDAVAIVTIHDPGHAAVSMATVTGSWSNGANGSGSCVTNGSGQCSIEKNNNKKNVGSVTFTVTGVTGSGLNYAPGANDVADSVVVPKP